jgi:hypothetical protein
VSGAVEVRAEIVKLARLLQREPAELEYLDQVPAEDIRELRELATERLFTAQGNTLARFAAAARVIPPSVTATLAQRAFGPLLSARIAGTLDPARAVDVAAKLPPPFLADVAVELDPRRASDVIARIPARLVAEVTAELVRREEYVTMGRFVGHIAPEALTMALAVMSDHQLLHVAFVLEQKEGLDGLIDLLGPARLKGVLEAAAEEGLWPEALDLFANLSDARAAAIANAAAAEEDRILDSLIASAQENQIWEAVLPLARVMDEDALRRFAGLKSIQAPEVLDAIVAAAAVHELWAELLPLIGLLDEDARQHVARTAAILLSDLDETVRESVVASLGAELRP